MEERYLIDSNMLIDFLGRLLPPNGKQLVARIIDRGELTISVITYIEVLGFQAPEDYSQQCKRLFNLAEIVPLVDLPTIEQVILIRRETKIKLPDAIIAATDLTRDLTLISRNRKDFSRVEGLKWINPHEL